MKSKHYLIDSSYVCYYASVSAFKQYCYHFDIPKTKFSPDFDPTIDPEFCIILENVIKRCIRTPLQKIVPFIDNTQYIFCIDCARKNIWRRDIYPEYKIARDFTDTSTAKFNSKAVFNYIYNYIIPGICDEYNATKVSCNIAEGDDIIAVLTEYYMDNTSDDIIIVSGDKDMVQLYSDRTTITTIEGNKRTPKLELEKAIKKSIKQDITSRDFLLFKILIGDISDRNSKCKIWNSDQRRHGN